MYHSRRVPVCHRCGRQLEDGETCNCTIDARGAPKDGLRALCPAFKARSFYKGKYYISCCGKFRFDKPGERNEHYKEYCCRNWLQCEIYNTREKKEND